MLTVFDWLEQQIAMMERKPEDVLLDFEGDLPMSGTTMDGAKYEILPDPLGGHWNVWVTHALDEQYEACDRVFHGSLNECKNYVYWNMEVDA